MVVLFGCTGQGIVAAVERFFKMPCCQVTSLVLMTKERDFVDHVYHQYLRTLVDKLHRYYVFPDVAENVSSFVTEAIQSGRYDGITDPSMFAAAVTEDMISVSHDKHLRLFYKPGQATEQEEFDGADTADDELQSVRQEYEPDNFGFYRVERLRGNIGYLDIRRLLPVEVAGDTAVAAMNFIAGTYALIVDLRNNGGGVPSMVDLLCGYLFRPSQHINSFYLRHTDNTEQYWSLPYVLGKHYGKKPVFVLTSSRTFSGAEEFAYSLKHHQRAKIIGERTKGGAHPGMGLRITADFEVFMPMGRAIHPVTHSNWEGTGVEPDVEVSEDTALDRAYMEALEDVLSVPNIPQTVCHEARQALQELREATDS